MQTPYTNTSNDTFTTVKTIIAEQTGNEPQEITLQSHIEDDLNIDVVADFPRIVTKINQTLDIRLVAQDMIRDFFDDKLLTIEQLVETVDEEAELG